MAVDFIHMDRLPCKRAERRSYKIIIYAACLGLTLLILSCSVVSTTYDIGKGTVKATCKTVEVAAKVGMKTGEVAFGIGKFTFDVVTAPLSWPMTQDIESIDGLTPKEAIQQGRVKNSPYVVKGRHYKPMSVDQASCYKEKGIASWYGYETYHQKDGHMTANGEAFDPRKPSAAHKYLPLPTNVKVTNLDNGKSMILRVNDRGPFVRGRIIDVSAGAAKRLGFYDRGTARVKVETIELN